MPHWLMHNSKFVNIPGLGNVIIPLNNYVIFNDYFFFLFLRIDNGHQEFSDSHGIFKDIPDVTTIDTLSF